MTVAFTVRPACTDDVGLILNSWLKSYRQSEAARTVTNEIYYSENIGEKARIVSLMRKGQTLVACDPTEQDIVFGWVCADAVIPPVVHYVYVKSPYRRRGLARKLLKAAGVGSAPFLATHETYDVRGRINYVYCPWYVGLEER